MKPRVLAVLGLLAGMSASPAGAQLLQEEQRAVRLWGGIQLAGAVATGEFADYVDGGVGLALNLVAPVAANSPLAVRLDAGWLVYGSETTHICLISCRVRGELTTTNNIFYVGAGPQLMIPAGAVRPYVNGNVGLAYFSTTSSLKGDNNNETFASDTNFDDITLAWGGGGGVLIPLSSGRTPIALDIGGTYHANGSVEYLREGDIVDNPDGSLTINTTRSEANFVTLRLGVAIGFRGGTPR